MAGINFSNSEQLLNRALKVIPNGTQTFSKSRTQYPVGAAPLYIQRAKGSHVWDVDGNEYIDFVSGLGSIILGYCDEDVDNAVKEQIDQGSIYSLPHQVEIEVAETLCEIIPCAEMVRFGKNGSDATSGAVKLARYITGRDHIITCEGHYHGWQDWSNGITARNGGVPDVVKRLTHTFKYNDLDSLHSAFKQWPDIACVIMEPMTWIWPDEGFLEEVKAICHKQRALLIFDEMLTGFRFIDFSAQKEFGIIPDLACFGKAMANGYPISAIVGKADIMRKMEEIHFSFTFGGDCVALAATRATIQKLQRSFINYISHEKYLKGYRLRPKWDFSFLGENVREKIFQECYQNRILVLDYVNFNCSHTYEENEYLKQIVQNAIDKIDNIELKGQRIDLLFQVRA